MAVDSPARQVCVSCVLKPIYPQFLAIQQRHLAAVGPVLARGDGGEARRLAHAVKGACATYELPDAAAMAREAETAILDGRQADALAWVGRTAAYLDAVEVVFAATQAGDALP